MIVYRIYAPDDKEHDTPYGRLKPVNEVIDGMLKTYFLAHDEMDIHIVDAKVHGIKKVETEVVGELAWQSTGHLGECHPPISVPHAILRQEMAVPGEEIYEYPKWE